VSAADDTPAAAAPHRHLVGYTIPRTPEGRSSLVPYPPWHYVGTFLVIDYWADPEKAVAFLPAGIDPHPDPGRCAFVAADWQSCSEGGDELVDPSRSQYREVFVVVSGLLGGEEVTVCTSIWVDRDFALARGWIQGFPKKLGSIWITRSFGLGGPADPGMQAGACFGVTCAAYERRIAQATVTLEHPSAGGPFHNAPPIVNVRHFPRLAHGRHEEPAVHELVRAVSRDRSISEVWEGSATLELFGAAHEEVDALAPVEIGRGYRFTFAYTVDDLETVRELGK
jgi:acetoacetate decarboxylase